MAKLSRFTQLLFGSSASANQMAEFGSFAASTPARYSGSTITPTIIQSLSQYVSGWFSAIVGGNSPCIEDMNALCYLFAYQLAYLMQEGVAEWDSGTTYYTGSFVNSSGVLYTSLQDNNLNNAVTNAAYWAASNTFAAETFSQNGTWTAPAGVSQVIVTGKRSARVANEYGTPFLIDSFNRAFTWGDNTNGQLGVGDVNPRSSPTLVLGGLIYAKIDNGFDSLNGTPATFGLTPTGVLYAWGINNKGQLGVGNIIPQSSPVLVLGGLTFQTVKVGLNLTADLANSTFGLTPAGALYAWGSNGSGQLGVGNVTAQSSPVAVLESLTFSAVSSYGASTFGLTSSGVLYAWGLNTNGQLGLGNVTSQSSPVVVLGGLTFQAVYQGNGSAATGSAVFGLTPAGALYAWGLNTTGELGIGNVTPQSSPVAVLGGLTFTKIWTSKGLNEAPDVYGLTSSGTLYAWGSNAFGELGVGNSTPQSSPVLVLGGLAVAKVIPGNRYALILTTTGALYATGVNGDGELGVGDVTSRSSPVLVLGGITFKDAGTWTNANNSTAAGSSFGISTAGVVYAWGINTNGNLGTGDVNPRSSPVAVVGGVLSNTQDALYSQAISVVPGQSYAVTVQQFSATFGASTIGQGPLDQITVVYG